MHERDAGRPGIGRHQRETAARERDPGARPHPLFNAALALLGVVLVLAAVGVKWA